MERQVYYCKSWFRAKKRPTEIWAQEKAEKAHVEGLPYTVLVGSLEQPFCFLDVAKKSVGVGFLDMLLREALTYGFQEVEPGKLFLAMATYREFVGDTDGVANGTSYIFGRDGSVTIRRESFVPAQELTISTSIKDAGGHYSAMPLFGAYDDLIRVERIDGPRRAE